MRNAIITCALLGMVGCCTVVSPPGTRETEAVAAVFTKTAAYVYSQDFVGFEEPLSNAFSQTDLRILGDHRFSVESMIETALGLQDSIWGAKLAAHFRINKVLPLLRSHFMTPRRCYGWEGPDYTKLESYLADDQYVYSVAYLDAIETITGESVDKAIHLTQAEVQQIAKYAVNQSSDFYHWSLWMQRKLKITNRPNQVPEDTARKVADPQH